MSKIKALITTLLLSSSSVALAAPEISFHTNGNANATWKLPGDVRPGHVRPGATLAWTPLSQMLSAQRYTSLRVSEARDDLAAIKLRAGRGATYIYSIYVYFDDGTRQVIPVSKWIYGNSPELSYAIARDRGGVDRMIITTWTGRRDSTFQVLGRQIRQARPPVVAPPPPAPPPIYNPPPTALVIADNISFANTQGYVHLPVGTEKGRFQHVRLEGTGAATYVGHVHVTFANGSQQVLMVNRTLYRGQTVDLELEGKAARAITALTIMADHNVHQVGPSASRLTVSLL